MININGKEFKKITKRDVINFLEDEETEENFFIEFKEDDVSNKKLIEEICAFSNTLGGYIFIGVSDKKEIKGCTQWTEQRVTTIIIDSITPIPMYEIKKVSINNKEVYVIKVYAGDETPYITNSGSIYERVGSSSAKVTKADVLLKLYEKSEKKKMDMEKYLSISQPNQNINNLYAYLDIGFALQLKNKQSISRIIFSENQDKLVEILKKQGNRFSISRVGTSIFITLADISSKDQKSLPADLENFMEIMIDGSVRLRTLFISEDEKNVKFQLNLSLLLSFMDAYKQFIAKEVCENFISLYKYEKLTVLKQFTSSYMTGTEEYDKQFCEFDKESKKKYGEPKVISSVRIPRTGLLRIDREYFVRNKIKFNVDNLLNELFYSYTIDSGYIEPFKYKNKDKE